MDLINIIKSINDEDNLNIATTNPSLFSDTSYNIEKIEGDFNYKRFFHFIVIDEEYLNDVGFSAISKIDEWQIIKKVHSWNDF